MAYNFPNDGRIGKDINWSLVIPSIMRPVWEAPALEVLDRFEEFLEHGDIQDSLNLNNPWLIAEYPDVRLRCRYIDVVCEGVALSRHLKWAEETHTAAMKAGDPKKMAFYEGLVEALRFDKGQLLDEHVSIWELRVPREYTMRAATVAEAQASSKSMKETLHAVEEKEYDGGHENASDFSSTTSYVTAADDIPVQNMEDLADLTTLEPSFTANTVI